MNDNAPSRSSHRRSAEAIIHDNIVVRVEIYREAGSDDGWLLEVVNQKGTSTVWDDLFAADIEAFAEFQETLEAEGIHAFQDGPSSSGSR
jgi:hypothetical protein